MPAAGQITRTHCKGCNIKLEESNCYWVGPQNRGPRCRECHKLHKYGITVKEYNEMFEFQSGVCAICFYPPKDGTKLSVDHNHINGVIRGLLCRDCNFVLGYLKDNEDLTMKVVDYLRRTTWSKICLPQV